MEKDSNLSAKRASGTSPTRRSPPALEAFLDKAAATNGPALQQILKNAPESRPEAVALAKRLIADPGYPPPEMERALAKHLAGQLTNEINQLPS
jgi:hypothetical protein